MRQRENEEEDGEDDGGGDEAAGGEDMREGSSVGGPEWRGWPGREDCLADAGSLQGAGK
jgi:hypothetical protein